MMHGRGRYQEPWGVGVWEAWSEDVGLCEECQALPDGHLCYQHDMDDDDVLARYRAVAAAEPDDGPGRETMIHERDEAYRLGLIEG